MRESTIIEQKGVESPLTREAVRMPSAGQKENAEREARQASRPYWHQLLPALAVGLVVLGLGWGPQVYRGAQERLWGGVEKGWWQSGWQSGWAAGEAAGRRAATSTGGKHMASYLVSGAGDSSFNGVYVLVGNDSAGNAYYVFHGGSGDRWLGCTSTNPAYGYSLTTSNNSATGMWGSADSYSNDAGPLPGTWNVTSGTPPAPTVITTRVISGTVLDRVNHPAAGALITATATGQTTVTATSAADGTYTLSGLADSTVWTLTATHAGWTFDVPAKAVTLAGADVTGENFLANLGTVNGKVTDFIPQGPGTAGVTCSLGGTLTATSDATGAFQIWSVPAGAYTLVFTKSGGQFTLQSVPVVVGA